MNLKVSTELRMRFVCALVMLVASCSLVACGSGKSKPGRTEGGGSQHQAVWPLTGRPQESAPSWPVAVVKVPNTAEARPQIGLAEADMVTEELVEGGITRLAVFFDSIMPDLVGPVRSMRTSDISLVKPLAALLVSSGAAPTTLDSLNRAQVSFIQDGSEYFRDQNRLAPYDLMIRLRQRMDSIAKRSVQPEPYFDFAPSGAPFVGAKAISIAVTFSDYRTTRFGYEGGQYVNTNGYTTDAPFRADNVLVLRVREANAGYLDPAGNPVPESVLSGSGPFTLFHHGVAISGVWSKSGPAGHLSLTDAKDRKVLMPVGKTYLALAPLNSSFGTGGLSFS